MWEGLFGKLVLACKDGILNATEILIDDKKKCKLIVWIPYMLFSIKWLGTLKIKFNSDDDLPLKKR